MKQARVIYWYPEKTLVRDGGGMRALAWRDALTSLGYKTTVEGIAPAPLDSSERRSLLRRMKRHLVPMPLKARLPEMPPADLYVVTVPAAFEDALKRLPASKLVFDWMDLWSVNAHTMGLSAINLVPGGLLQSLWWRLQERRLPSMPAANAFAGHNDFLKLASKHAVSTPSKWLPTPIDHSGAAAVRPSRSVKRIGFLGNMHYPPNVMSLKKFLKKNKRRIAEAGIELVVAGYGSDGIPEWGRQGVTISGPVDRVADFYSSVDAALVPIYHGGGIKVKAVEAMAHGIPVYGTKHVREGFHEDFWTYIGDIDDLVADSSTAVPVAPVAQVASRFSSGRFCESVEELLSEAGI